MQKKDFTQYKTKEDFLKDFPIRNGTLNLSYKQINDDDLKHILELIGEESSLKELSLHQNQLTTLPVGVFEGLSSLKGLDLHQNQLTTLPVGVFEGLSSLKFLSLSYNKLTTLTVGVFEGLSSLEYLYLRENQLTTLPVGVFEGLSSLKFLSLFSNKLTTLPVGIFKGLSNLKDLYLRENQLTTLPVGVFEGLSSLKGLDLSCNKLTTLPVGIFKGLSNLKCLYLHQNQLTTLPKSLQSILPNCNIIKNEKCIFVDDVASNQETPVIAKSNVIDTSNAKVENIDNEITKHLKKVFIAVFLIIGIGIYCYKSLQIEQKHLQFVNKMLETNYTADEYNAYEEIIEEKVREKIKNN